MNICKLSREGSRKYQYVELEHLLVHVHANWDGVQGTIFTCADEGWNTLLYSFVMQLAQEKHSTIYGLNGNTVQVRQTEDRRSQKEVLLRLFVHNVTLLRYVILKLMAFHTTLVTDLLRNRPRCPGKELGIVSFLPTVPHCVFSSSMKSNNILNKRWLWLNHCGC